MKKQLFTLCVIASFSVVKPALAETSTGDNTDKELQKISTQTTALESEVSSLKKEIRQLKSEQRHLQKTTYSIQTMEQHPHPDYAAIRSPISPVEPILPAVRNSPVVYLSGTPVVIAPYIGEHSAFNALDLVINYSSYNLDLNLLQLRQQIDKQYKDAHVPVPSSPMLMLSGKVEGQAIYSEPYNGAYSTSKIDLSSAELDVIPTINDWASGYISLAYDNSAQPNTPLVNNSRLRAKRAFMTFGNLDKFPIYMTIGQMDVPFGDYGTFMISDILPQDIFQTRARTILLGYQNASGQGPYAEVFAFNGDSNTNHNNNINNLGINGGFKFTEGKVNGDIGGSAIANIADSLVMQQTGAAGFPGFSVATSMTKDPELLQRQVPGVAFHGNLGIGPFGLMGRYVEATSPFAFQDLTYNGQGARPHALDAEAYYNFHTFSKPSVITAAYDKSWEALALGIPQERYMAAFMTSIWRSTIQEIEFRHDVNYPVSDNASGAGIATPAFAKGGSSNTVTLQLGIYF